MSAPLPPDLPAPIDDGAADHLPGRPMPALTLPATDGAAVQLDQLGAGRTVIYCYPLTGRPDRAARCRGAEVVGTGSHAHDDVPEGCRRGRDPVASERIFAYRQNMTREHVRQDRPSATQVSLVEPLDVARGNETRCGNEGWAWVYAPGWLFGGWVHRRLFCQRRDEHSGPHGRRWRRAWFRRRWKVMQWSD